MNAISPLAPASFPDIPPVPGVRLATAGAGIRYVDRDDLLLVGLSPDTTAGGVFTTSATAAPPVDWCRASLAKTVGRAAGLVVNAGNANAFTGRAGRSAVERIAANASHALGCQPEQVYVAATGTIGEPLPVEKVTDRMLPMARTLRPGGWEAAARAIMTTDTFPKGAWRRLAIDGQLVTIAGVAKGSGMIAPDMATMLAFVFTDAALPAPVVQDLVESGAKRTFNCITVDSDTSTSDTLMLFATGQARHLRLGGKGDKARLKPFRDALFAVMHDLALQVVRDGEGASKLIRVTVSGAAGKRAARTIAMAIANSPLVKTAIAGEDANWGRIVMAVGKAGEKADRDKLAIDIGGVAVARDGDRVPDYDEAPVAAHMTGREIDISVDVGVGKGKATVWTCDLTHDYIRINAHYRT